MWRIIEAYDRINAWIRTSEGQFIELDNGESYRFVRHRTFTGRQLEDFEQKSGIVLPPEYKRFLIGVGAVELFAGPLSAGIQVLGPDELADFSRAAFAGSGDDPYPALLPAVSMPEFGTLGGFHPENERERRYVVLEAEDLPGKGTKLPRLMAFDDWIADLAESRGKVH